MRKGLGLFILQIAVALYLIAVGVMAITGVKDGQLVVLLSRIGLGNNVIFIIAGIIALAAGIGELLELFGVEISILNTLVFVIAIIWAVFIIIQIIGWITKGFPVFWMELSLIGVNCMVLGSLLNSSGRFDR